MKIIMYHYVRPKSNDNGNLRYLTSDQFQSQLDFFDKNYDFLSIEEFKYNFENNILSKKVLLTFDDGLIDHFDYVFPILKERNIKGIFYVPSSILINKKILNVHKIHYLLSKIDARSIYVESEKIIKGFEMKISKQIKKETYSYSSHDDYELRLKKLFNYKLTFEEANLATDNLINYFNLNDKYFYDLYLNKNQIKEMYNDGQIFGSHTLNHKILSSLNYKDQLHEIKDSFNILSEYIDDSFRSISYPFGYKFTYNTDTFEALKNQKVDYAFIFDNKIMSSFNNYEISRIDCNNFIK
jgi:peptidoglycan/xylan/chitin deacetylase (PgdA/CDA1 family)